MNSFSTQRTSTNAFLLVSFLYGKAAKKPITKFFKRLKKVLFGVFYLVSSNKDKTKSNTNAQKTIALVQCFIFTLQLMSLLWYRVDFTMEDWESYRLFWAYLRVVNLDVLVVGLFSGALFMSFSLVLTLTATLGLVVLGVLVHLKKKIPSVFKFLLQKLLDFICGVAYLPLVTFSSIVFVNSFRATPEVTEYRTFDLEITEYYGVVMGCNLVLVVTLYILYQTLSLEMRHCFAKKDINAGCSAKYRVREGLVLVFVSILKILLFQEKPYLYLGILMFLSFYMFAQYLVHLPYYLLFTNYVKASSYLILGIEGFIFFVSFLSQNAFLTVIMTCCVTPLLVIPIKYCFEVMESKIPKPLFSKLHKLRSLEEFELCIRNHMIRSSLEEKKLLLKAFGKCFEKAVFKTEKKLYIWETHLCLLSFKNERLARLKIWKCIGKNTNTEAEFQEFCCRKAFGLKAFDDLDYIQYLLKLTEVSNLDHSLCFHLVNFWNELISSHPKLCFLRNQSQIISQNMTRIQEISEKLIENHSRHAEIYEIYGSFLNELLFDSEKAIHLLRKGEMINSYNNSSIKYSSKLKFYDNQNGVLLVSGSPSNFGHIIYSNRKASEILESPIENLLNAEFSNFIPEPYNHNHNSILQNFLTSCEKPKMPIPKNFVLVNNKGYLIEIFISGKILSLEGYPIISLMIRDPCAEREVALVHPDGTISAHSQMFPSKLGYFEDLKGFNIKAIEPALVTEDKYKRVFRKVNGQEIALVYEAVPMGSSEVNLVWLVASKQDLRALRKAEAEDSLAFQVQKTELGAATSEENLEKPRNSVKFLEENHCDPLLTERSLNALSSNEQVDKLPESFKGSSHSNSSYSNSVFSKTRSAESMFKRINRSIYVFRWILFFSILSVLVTYGVMIIYTSNAVSRAKRFKGADRFNELKIKLVETAVYARAVDIFAELGLNEYLEPVNQSIYQDAEALDELLHVKLEPKWKDCSSSKIYRESSIEVWENYFTPKVNHYNLIDAANEFSQIAKSFTKSKVGSEEYKNHLFYLVANGVGPMFKSIDEALDGFIVCDIEFIEQLDSYMNILLILVTTLLALCFTLLIPNSIDINRKISVYWNEMRKLAASAYYELRQNVIMRLSDMHGEIDLNSDEENFCLKMKRFKEVNLGCSKSYICRLLVFVLVSCVFYFLSYFVFYSNCKEFLSIRPTYMQHFKNMKSSLIQVHFWAAEASFLNTQLDIRDNIKHAYLFSNPESEYQRVSSKIKRRIHFALDKEVRKLITPDTESSLFEDSLGTEVTKFQRGIYNAYLGLIGDYDYATKIPLWESLDILITLFSENSALREKTESIFDKADTDSVELIDSELRGMMVFTVAYGVISLLLFFLFYLPFLKAEEKRLETMQNIGFLIPMQGVNKKSK